MIKYKQFACKWPILSKISSINKFKKIHDIIMICANHARKISKMKIIGNLVKGKYILKI